MSRISFYKDRICLNVLAGSLENAKKIVEAAEGYAAIGILSSSYPDVSSAVVDMQRYQEITQDRLSVGLGGGNPKQCYAVAELSAILKPAHVNQVFALVGSTRTAVAESDSWINAMIAPSGTPGLVCISTGPKSSAEEKALIPVATAVAMIQEMGGNSIKFFPMGGLKTKEEYRAVARACAHAGLALEPTGGIDLANFKEIMQIALEEQVQQIIPHVYSSIIDSVTGNTRIEDVRTLLAMVKELI